MLIETHQGYVPLHRVARIERDSSKGCDRYLLLDDRGGILGTCWERDLRDLQPMVPNTVKGIRRLEFFEGENGNLAVASQPVIGWRSFGFEGDMAAICPEIACWPWLIEFPEDYNPRWVVQAVQTFESFADVLEWAKEQLRLKKKNPIE